MPKILIKNPGLLTTIQDKGRWGFQNVGMPVAGAMDQYALRCANLLVGNDEYEGALEVTFMGPEIEFQCDEIISITGADMNPMVNGKEVPMWQSVFIKAGDVLKFSGVKTGLRGYIGFSRGFDVPVAMKSKSTYLRGNLGGFDGRALKQNDEISLNEKNLEEYGYILDEKFIPKYSKSENIRVVFGPQDDYFSEEAKKVFTTSEYVISSESDRMGFRLDGPKVEHLEGADIISDGIVFGSVQIPGHGNPIVMMADRQTTGGYTKIATVISADLPKVAQMGPGSKIKFEAISIEEAQDLFAENEKTFEEIKESIIKTKFNFIDSKPMDKTIVQSVPYTLGRTKKFKVVIDGEEFDITVSEKIE